MQYGSIIVYEGKRGRVLRIKYRDSNGRQVKETLGREADGWTHDRADAELCDRVAQVERLGFRKAARIGFAEYASAWFEMGPRRRGWRASTAAQYCSVHERLADYFGDWPLAKIRPFDIAQYVRDAEADFGPFAINRDISILHAIFKTAQREELISANPTDGAERPRLPPSADRSLRPEQVQPVDELLSGLERLVFRTLVLTGIRRSELLELRWPDVDLERNVLRVRKSKTDAGERSIAIAPTLANDLRAHHAARGVLARVTDRVFCTAQGCVYRPETFRAALKVALAAAGIETPLRPFHDLRHTAITLDAAAGSSEIAVMTRAGHRSMATTKRYLHLAGSTFAAEAAAVEERVFGSL